jgi:hypothetical protein
MVRLEFDSQAAIDKWTKVAAEQLPVSTADLFWVNVDILKILTQNQDVTLQDHWLVMGGRLMKFNLNCQPDLNNPEQVA